MTPERFEIEWDSSGGLFTEFCPQGEQALELLAPLLAGQDPLLGGSQHDHVQQPPQLTRQIAQAVRDVLRLTQPSCMRDDITHWMSSPWLLPLGEALGFPPHRLALLLPLVPPPTP